MKSFLVFRFPFKNAGDMKLRKLLSHEKFKAEKGWLVKITLGHELHSKLKLAFM